MKWVFVRFLAVAFLTLSLVVSFQVSAASGDRSDKIEKVEKIEKSEKAKTPSSLTRSGSQKSSATGAIEVSDPAEAVSDLNDFIVDLYKPKIDKLLEEFQSATYKATRGNVRSEVATYVRLGETVEKRIDALEDQKLTPNRKAILKGVLEYLHTRIGRMIEGKKGEITNSFDS